MKTWLGCGCGPVGCFALLFTWPYYLIRKWKRDEQSGT